MFSNIFVAILFVGVSAVGVITVLSAVFGVRTKPTHEKWEDDWSDHPLP